MIDNKLLSSAQAEEILNITHRKFLELVNTGQLKAQKIGRQYRVSETAIKEFIK